MLSSLFWDVDFNSLSFEEDRQLIATRILASGTWDAVTWLRSRLGDRDLRLFILGRGGRGLSPQQLRFWELVLDLPRGLVDGWLKERRGNPWDCRQAS